MRILEQFSNFNVVLYELRSSIWLLFIVLACSKDDAIQPFLSARISFLKSLWGMVSMTLSILVPSGTSRSITPRTGLKETSISPDVALVPNRGQEDEVNLKWKSTRDRSYISPCPWQIWQILTFVWPEKPIDFESCFNQAMPGFLWFKCLWRSWEFQEGDVDNAKLHLP